MKLIQYLSLAVFLLSLLVLLSFYTSANDSAESFIEYSRPSAVQEFTRNENVWLDDNITVIVGLQQEARPVRVELNVDGTPYTYYWVVRAAGTPSTEVRVTAAADSGMPASIQQRLPDAPPATIESRNSQDNEIIVQYATQVAEVRTWATASADTYATREAILLEYATTIQASSSDDSALINLWFVALISLATFLTTTGFRIRDERRYELESAKLQLEIHKLRKELDDKTTPAKKPPK